jgi:serine/threonine-protein kinase
MAVMDNEPAPPRLLNRQIDPDLEKIVLKCLEKPPELRYASAQALADDLRRFLHGETISARSVNLLERVYRELAHSQYDAHLRPWGVGLMLLGLLIFVAHLATSLLLVGGCERPVAFWVPRTILLLLLGPMLVKYRPHASIWPTNAIERLLWAVWIGYLLAFGSLFWVMHVLSHNHLQVYGVAAAAAGLAWFAMGGSVWGGCYLIGASFLLLAPALAWMARDAQSPGALWSPFAFGVLWSAALVTLGQRYRRLGKEPG